MDWLVLYFEYGLRVATGEATRLFWLRWMVPSLSRPLESGFLKELSWLRVPES